MQLQKIELRHMSFAEGMFMGPSMTKYAKGHRQVDWDKVSQFIEEHKEEILKVSAGLAEDWGCTAGKVWDYVRGYIPKDDTYVYGASAWATPAIEVVYKDGRVESYECWKLGTDAHDYFKDEAVITSGGAE